MCKDLFIVKIFFKDSRLYFSCSKGGAISKPLTDQTVAESQEAVFECEVANPDSEGEWLKDGKHLPLSKTIRSESDGRKRRLIIAATKLDDIGEYTYKVATSKTSAKLKVEGQSYNNRVIHFKSYCIFDSYPNSQIV